MHGQTKLRVLPYTRQHISLTSIPHVLRYIINPERVFQEYTADKQVNYER